MNGNLSNKGLSAAIPQTEAPFILCLSIFFILISYSHYEAYRAYNKSPDFAYACDDFGYLRQARLFQQNGLLGGFDTALTDDDTLYLLRKLKELAEPPAWSEAVGPHCHSYQTHSDRVTLQYPPLTGLFLSFFNEGTQTRWALATANVIIAAFLSYVAVIGRRVTVPLLCAALGALLFLGLRTYAFSRSIVGSTVLLTILGYLTVRLSDSWIERRQTWIGFPVGLVLGLTVGFRIPNILVASGFIVILSIHLAREPSTRALRMAFLATAGFVLGVAPVLIANNTNAGGPLYTTYGPGNTQPIQWTMETLQSGLRYYLDQGTVLRDLIASLSLIAIALAFSLWRRRPELALAVTIALTSLLTSIAFMLMHTPRIIYYLNPAAVFAEATAMFCLIAAENRRNGRVRTNSVAPRFRAATIVVVSIVAMLVPRFMAMPTLEPQETTASFPPRSIVWADLLTGTISYYMHRQSALLPFMSESLQDRIIAAVASDGRRQYLIVDSPTMETTASRLRTMMELRPAGKAFGSSVFELVSGTSTP